MESLFIQLSGINNKCINLNLKKLTLMTVFVVHGHIFMVNNSGSSEQIVYTQTDFHK